MKLGSMAALDGDDGPFVPALIAVLVYLASIALAVMLLIGSAADRWQEDLAGRLTVQLGQAGEQAPADRLDAALARIRSEPEVARAEPVPENRLLGQLPAPLGASAPNALPLPAVIEVDLKPEARAQGERVRAELRAALAPADVDAGSAQRGPALRLMHGIEWLAALVLCVLAATLAACVVFATRARLAARAETIEVLHLLGADDVHIVADLARRALLTSLAGVLGGFALALLTLIAIALVADELPVGELAGSLSRWAWLCVLALPVAAAAIAVLTSRVTALRALAAMP